MYWDSLRLTMFRTKPKRFSTNVAYSFEGNSRVSMLSIVFEV